MAFQRLEKGGQNMSVGDNKEEGWGETQNKYNLKYVQHVKIKN